MTAPALRLAAHLACAAAPPGTGGLRAEAAGASRSGPGPGEQAAVNVIAALRAGKVPLVEVDGALAPAGAAGLLGSGAWRAAVSREVLERDAIERAYAPVAAALVRAGVEAVLFKAVLGLPYRSSNLDLLVRPARLEDAARLLGSLGHLQLPHYREEGKLLFRRFHQGRSVLCVHLHARVSWGRIVILGGDEVVARSRPAPGGGHRLASLEDLVLITLAHALYETDEIRLSDVRALRLAVQTPGFRWDAVADRARARGWAGGLLAMLRLASELERALHGDSRVPEEVLEGMRGALGRGRAEGRLVGRTCARLRREGVVELPLRLPRWWTKGHYVARLLAAPDRAPDEGLADVASTACNLLANRLRIRCRPASVVSVSGLDGAGKSAAVGALKEALELCEVPARVVWSRGGFTPALAAVKRAARAVPGAGVPAVSNAEAKGRWLRGRTRGFLFAAAVLAEQAAAHRLRVSLPRRLGFTIVCDRSGYDLAADLIAKLGPGRPLARRAARLAVACVPGPDLALLLRLPASEAARRKPAEGPEGLLETQARAFDELAGPHGLQVVDAARPEAEVLGEVVERVLRAVFARFRAAGGRETAP